jgi:hypothetical protein
MWAWFKYQWNNNDPRFWTWMLIALILWGTVFAFFIAWIGG